MKQARLSQNRAPRARRAVRAMFALAISLGAGNLWAQDAPPAAAPVSNARAALPVWSAANAAQAQPVWPAAAVPATIAMVPLERLAALRAGMGSIAVTQLLGPPHATLKGAGGEVWQFVVLDSAKSRAFIASLWFDGRGLWRASGQSRPIGQLAQLKFDAAVAPAAVVSAPAPGIAPPLAQEASPPAAPAPAPVVAADVPPTPPVQVATPADTGAPPAMPVVPVTPPAASNAAAIPAPMPEQTKSQAVDAAEVAAVLKEVLTSWLADWSGRDVSAYLAHYADDYPAAGKAHAAWAEQRKLRLQGPGFIHVAASQVDVQGAAGSRPKLTFVQAYESDRYRETSKKTLTFVHRQDRWLITGEENTPLPK